MESDPRKQRIITIIVIILLILYIYGFGVVTGLLILKKRFTIKETNKTCEIHQRESLAPQNFKKNESKTTLDHIDICPLINSGSLCYFNTLIQCMYSCKDLKDFFMNDSEMTEVKEILKELFERMAAKDKTINTKEFLKRIVDITSNEEFEDLNQQQDIHSLYLNLINGCFDPNFDVGNIISPDIFDDFAIHNFIFRKLYFLIEISSKESNTEQNKITYEPGNAFLLPTKKFNLYKDLKRYFEKAVFKKKNDNNEEIEVETTKELIRFPDILVLYTPYHEATLPDEIDIHRNIVFDQNIKYRLIAFGCHLGNESSGHYIAIKRMKDNTWAIINDDFITFHSWENVLKYLNYYKIKPTLSFLEKI
ncbi:putative ubiquitin carboxyl-terminal hydrolase [Hamiltosporidium tvaerminnensis]|uniref:Putative ubiquitin carboxyl-terminal hydrolase n=1 Tax=Hamiltosporidium tvaerminnensis TaxID=1176355 RepID=A0A4Q9LSE9_9MICR|nr:putative ubiquitin carboxyl-terminal hydrolase [Hamiltosporidium tvaerminnensis]